VVDVEPVVEPVVVGPVVVDVDEDEFCRCGGA